MRTSKTLQVLLMLLGAVQNVQGQKSLLERIHPELLRSIKFLRENKNSRFEWRPSLEKTLQLEEVFLPKKA